MDRVVCDNIPRCINAGRGDVPFSCSIQTEDYSHGLPSPASDYVETRISLDQQLISQPAATYFMRASRSHFREGIIQGALLVVDASLSACDGSLLICAIDGEFRIKRYRTHPQPHLINLENGRKEALPEDGDGYNSSHAIFGVITYIINDARNAEFDDCPVM